MIDIVQGDMLAIVAGVEVLSAHPKLMAGSGLSGHFHRQADPELEAALKDWAVSEPQNSALFILVRERIYF